MQGPQSGARKFTGKLPSAGISLKKGVVWISGIREILPQSDAVSRLPVCYPLAACARGLSKEQSVLGC